MGNTFNNCTFNSSKTTNVYIENLNINISNNDNNSNDSDSSLAVGVIGLIGIGCILYPSAIPIFIAKAVSVTKLALTVGATTSSGLLAKELVKHYVKSRNELKLNQKDIPLIPEDSSYINHIDCTQETFLIEENTIQNPNDLFTSLNYKENNQVKDKLFNRFKR